MTDLYYKDTRVSPNSFLGCLLVELKNPKLPKAERAAKEQQAERLYQECEAEYRKWGNK